MDWFPRLRAMSLSANESEGEQNEARNRSLQSQLENTQQLVANLTQQLIELKEQVFFLFHALVVCNGFDKQVSFEFGGRNTVTVEKVSNVGRSLICEVIG